MSFRSTLRNIVLFPVDLCFLAFDWTRLFFNRVSRPLMANKRTCPFCRDTGYAYTNKKGRACFSTRKYSNDWLGRSLCANLQPCEVGDAPFECEYEKPAQGPVGRFFAVGLVLVLIGLVTALTLQVQINFFPRAVNKVRVTLFGPPIPEGLANDPALRELQIRLLRLNAKEARANPELAALYEEQGDSHAEEGALRMSRLEYAIAAKLNPSHATLWHKLGMSYLRLGAVAPAQQAFQQEIDAAGDTELAHGALAITYGLEDRTEDAFFHAVAAHELSDDGNVNALLELMGLYTQRRNIEAADAVAQAALDRNPENPRALATIADAIVRFGNTRAAEPYFRKALELAPDHLPSLLGLANVLVKQDQIEEAEAIIRQVTDISPDVLPARALSVEISRRRYGNSAAIQLLKDLREEFPDYRWAHTRLAEMMLLTGDFDRAYAISIELAGEEDLETRWAGLWLQARMFFARGLYKKAIEVSRPLTDQNRYALEARMLQAQAMVIRKELHAAVSQLNETVRHFPDYSQAYIRLCEALVLLGDPIQAESILERVMLQQEESAASYKLKGDYYVLSAKNPDLAREAYEKAIELDPDNNGLRYDYLHLLTEQSEELAIAETLALKLVEEQPDSTAFKDILGWIYFRQDRIEEAEVLIEQAVAGAPKMPVFRHHLGTLLHHQGDHEAAQRELRIALALKPGFYGANEARALLKEMEE